MDRRAALPPCAQLLRPAARPGGEKLATYVGWLLHGTRGGLAAGILFVLPGALVMLALSLLYAIGRGIPAVEGALFGIKAAVLVIVVEALIRIGKRALKTRLLVGVAAAAFIGIFFLAIPFPLIVVAAALIGFFVTRAPLGRQSSQRPGIGGMPRIAIACGLALWWAPIVGVPEPRPTASAGDVGLFFSKLAVVSFGGAYALLAYMAQQAVETYHWMSAPEMVDGLGLAETHPRAADPGDAVRRLPRRLPRPGAVRATRRGYRSPRRSPPG